MQMNELKKQWKKCWMNCGWIKIAAPQGVYADIQEFVQRMKNENMDTKQLGLVGRTKEKIPEELKAMYETL